MASFIWSNEPYYWNSLCSNSLKAEATNTSKFCVVCVNPNYERIARPFKALNTNWQVSEVQNIRENVLQPTDGDGLFCSSVGGGNDGATQQWECEQTTGKGDVTRIELWLNVRRSDVSCRFTGVKIRANGTWRDRTELIVGNDVFGDDGEFEWIQISATSGLGEMATLQPAFELTTEHDTDGKAIDLDTAYMKIVFQ